MADNVKNDQLLKTEQLPSFALNVVLVEYLNELVKTGLYGTKPTEAARKLITDGINQLIEAEQLPKIKYVESFKPEKNSKSNGEEQ